MEGHFCDSSNVSYSLQMNDVIDSTNKGMNIKTNQQGFNSRPGSVSEYSIRLIGRNVYVDRTADMVRDGSGEGMSSVTFINNRQVTPGSCIQLLSHRNRQDSPADMQTERNIFTKTSEGFDSPLNIGKLNEMNEVTKSCAQAYNQPQVITRYYAVPLLSDQTSPNFLHMSNTLIENSGDNSSNFGKFDFCGTSSLATTKPASSLLLLSDQAYDIVWDRISRIKPGEDDSCMNGTGYMDRCSLDVCDGFHSKYESQHPVYRPVLPPVEFVPIKQKPEYGSERRNPQSVDLTDQEFGITKEAVMAPKPSVKRWKCPDCSAEFSQVGVMRDHLFSEHKKKPFSCPVCAHRFRRKRAFNIHMRIHGPDEQLHVCRICAKKFTQRHQLDTHELVHNAKEGFSCHSCKRHFWHYKTYQKHKDKYHDETHPYFFHTCTVCGKQFVSKKGLKYHLAHHSANRKPYCCYECRQPFARESVLRCHMLKYHFTLKPFTWIS